MRIFKLYLPFELFDRIKLMAKFYNLSISKMMKELLEIGYIEILKNHNIDLSVLNENVEILNDTELNEKLEKLISVGKESRDISLMPSVLVKYDLKGLNNTISVLQISGLDPKKVPLMAY